MRDYEKQSRTLNQSRISILSNMNNIRVPSDAVSVEWLHSNINANNLIVLDGSIPKVPGHIIDYTETLIPRTQFFDIKKTFSDVSGRFPNTLPTAKPFSKEARNLGINTDSAIVVYDCHGVYSSARVWWMFKHFGHDNIAVLDGGLPEWIDQGFRIVSRFHKNDKIEDFKVLVESDRIIHFESLNGFIGLDNTSILDARSSKRFTGETPEPREGLRSGTIPNSLNLPYTEVLDGCKLKSKSELRTIFENLTKEKDTIIFSCGTGITACVLALGANIAGYQNIKVYDGSWTEYGSLVNA